MKVVQVLPSLRGGGVEKGTLEVAKFLVEQGHESLVVSAGGAMVSQLEAEGSRHVEWDLGKKSPLTFRHIWAFRRFLEKEKPDILHLRSRMPAWVCWLAWKGMPKAKRPKLVTTVHGLYSASKYSEIMCRGEAVIAVSETVRDYIFSSYPSTPRERVHLIYRGVDPTEFPYDYQPGYEWREKFLAQFPNARGKKLLCLPGRLTRLKGQNDFINLVESLSKDRNDIHGLIVGGEDPKRKDYAQELYNRVRKAGLAADITFTGARSDIREIFAMSDIVYSLSTKPESFGRTVLEALALGSSVVGYAQGGVGEVMSELYPEGLCEPYDAQKLLELSRQLLEVRVSPRRNKIFGLLRMLESTETIYKSTLKLDQ
jgi:glycosyltransferase involved in cell wall biosynthesis